MGFAQRTSFAFLLVAVGACMDGTEGWEGELTPQQAAVTTTTTVVADGRVESQSPTSNFGTVKLLADGNPIIRSFLKFQVAGVSGTVSSAKLKVWVRDGSGDAPAAYQVGTSWTETNLTWNSKPARVGGVVADAGAVPAGAWVEYDVSSVVKANGTFAFELASTSGDGVVVDSREQANPAQLTVVSSNTSPTNSLTVHLTPRSGFTGQQRVNFAVPLAPGQLSNANNIKVLRNGTEIPHGHRGLANYADGSLRSVQVQIDVSLSGPTDVVVQLGTASTLPALALASVMSTLSPTDGTSGPKVWAQLPATWLAASGVTGPTVTEASVAGTQLDAWGGVCDYDRYDTDAFLAVKSDKGPWLYDRGTIFYRGYARRGDLITLQSAYRDTSIYRNGISGTGTSTTIGVPESAGDSKYYYTQNLAIHYLLTGDDRFRESAENMAIKIAALWPSPGYAGGADFWTERHAGFALLGYVWAMIVSDDQAATFRSKADSAVTAYINVQETYPSGYSDSAARCFAHSSESAGEDYGTWGCSPWISAILADALDVYATERGGSQATAARTSIVKMGKIFARDGIDPSGKPYFWLGVGSAPDEEDPDDEHWGEMAYIMAMAWYHDGKNDTSMRNKTLGLLDGLSENGSAPHIRSFNWQCRSAVAAPFYLK